LEDLAGDEDERGSWPVDVGELKVPMIDVATRARFMGKSINT
jgi:hypothetical protein